ncbi:MAG: hypothetical protein ACOC6Q_00660 [Patescibacteria group bacterium]
MNKKIIILVIAALLIGAAGGYFVSDTLKEMGEDITDEEALVKEEPEEIEEAEEVEEEATSEKDQEVTDLYEEDEEITPISDKIVEFDEDMRKVLAEMDFENEPKLVSSSGITPITYVVDRPLTVEDAQIAYDTFKNMENYEIENTDSDAERYEISLSGEVAGEEYTGNLYVNFWFTKEGEENAQKIVVKTL